MIHLTTSALDLDFFNGRHTRFFLTAGWPASGLINKTVDLGPGCLTQSGRQRSFPQAKTAANQECCGILLINWPCDFWELSMPATGRWRLFGAGSKLHCCG